MTRLSSGLLAHQRTALEALRRLGLTTDDALVAALHELGEQVDRTTLVGWRSGRTQAPLGLLGAILGHLDVEERCLWLSALLRDWDVRVIATTTGDLRSDLAAAQAEIGRVLVATAEAASPTSPGGAELTTAEAAELASRFEQLARQAAQVAADLHGRGGLRMAAGGGR